MMRVLTVNAGSSSLKIRVLEGNRLLGTHDVDRWDGQPEPIHDALATYAVDAVGHRVVHGGGDVTEATVVDDEVLRYLDSLAPLAPLHQQRALDGVRAGLQASPAGTRSVVCVDTSFHHTLPPAARTYALPREWNREWGLRRFGFHGLSHSYAVRTAAEIVGVDLVRSRVLSCHLGAGASMAAVRDGRCVDTTMGMTPDEGLVMQTRSGSVDPGLVGWLLTEQGLTAKEVFDALRHRSGVAGLSGSSGDLRELLHARDQGDQEAALAFDVYRHSLTRHAGGLVATMGGLDLLVFTGGIGEHQAAVRAALCRDLEFLGVALDSERNGSSGDADLSRQGARVRTVVVESREDLEIARQTTELLT
ncbi:acetate/propionate family kinase [Allosaccharopolyspora coralli]|uniref:Acetate kinase n=1 Tax=Allosaccharopolyspora coralli TaxID=2665642 RepID=A0A5Q3QKU1_9PSEU|nr:acetate/propionate family kinase [Allosaccharopolyspora coralli]QGK72145.1 acetate/propionate family kinase [Allosaccharopolyspora coralli]